MGFRAGRRRIGPTHSSRQPQPSLTRRAPRRDRRAPCWYAMLPCAPRGIATRNVRANDSAHLFPEPCGTVCKRKLDCNTVRFKKFVMSHDRPCRAALIRREIRPHAKIGAVRNRITHAPHPHGPITVYSVDFARFRLHSVGYRGCALLSHVGGRWTVARSVELCGAFHIKRLPESQNAFPYRLEPSHLRRVSTSWQAALNARKGSRRLAEPYASLPFGASGNAKPPVRFTPGSRVTSRPW